MRIENINTTTPEGKLLIAAISLLSTSNFGVTDERVDDGIILDEIAVEASNIYGDKPDPVIMQSFQDDLSALLNRYSIESKSNTPTLIMAKYVIACLEAFTEATVARRKWLWQENDTLK